MTEIFRVFLHPSRFNPAVDLAPYRAFVSELAEKSGDFIRPFFGAPGLAVELKQDRSPVTQADRGAEELMRAMIRRRFPSHGIVGEEFAPDNPGAEFVWTLDPIDGTKSFAAACPLFGTLIALSQNGQPLLGAIHQPVSRQLLIGDGSSAELNGRPARVRRCGRIEDAVLLTSDPFNPGKYRDGAAWDALARRARVTRTWGDCYGYLLVATGWADAMCDPILSPWDIPALIPILRGAGGVITDWKGDEPAGADSLIASNPELHPAIVKALNP